MGYLATLTIGGADYKIVQSLYGTCNTASSTANKVVTCSDFDSFETGTVIVVKFDNSQTASAPYLNVNSTGNKQVLPSTWKVNYSGFVQAFVYDGSHWCALDWLDDTDTKNTAGSLDSGASKLYLIGATSQAAWTGTQSYVGVYATWNSATDEYSLQSDLFNGYALGAACEKAIGSVADNDTGLVTGDAVYDAIQAIQAGAMTYVGGVASLTDASHPLLNSSLSKGEVYAVTTSFTISDGAVTHTLEVGDLIIVNTSGTYTTQSALYAAIDIVQQNLDVLTTTDIDNAIAEAEAA
jgi:hypothetical protein